ncbi:hypothetical protein PFISCL1PPCAC_12204 [Pristionchus fissidentatus]|uniref:Uncharacterized protein n=1 Tax=Pristionchus fissidentatus TaxID=1538716 RepID=A0AAV5VSA5_9BILA|nr:hypothetical protein PFISCL1PPCAC_12204 [Pristionchus fissidentatus]
MAALQYPVVVADIPVRWDEAAWLPDPSPVFEDTANANYSVIREIDSHDLLLQQLVAPSSMRPMSADDDSDSGSGGNSDASGPDTVTTNASL